MPTRAEQTGADSSLEATAGDNGHSGAPSGDAAPRRTPVRRGAGVDKELYDTARPKVQGRLAGSALTAFSKCWAPAAWASSSGGRALSSRTQRSLSRPCGQAAHCQQNPPRSVSLKKAKTTALY